MFRDDLQISKLKTKLPDFFLGVAVVIAVCLSPSTKVLAADAYAIKSAGAVQAGRPVIRVAHPTEYGQYPRDNDSDYVPYQPDDGSTYQGYPQDNDNEYVPYVPQGKNDPYYGYSQPHEERSNNREPQPPADNDSDINNYPLYFE